VTVPDTLASSHVDKSAARVGSAASKERSQRQPYTPTFR